MNIIRESRSLNSITRFFVSSACLVLIAAYLGNQVVVQKSK
jgi:hypothetical protein